MQARENARPTLARRLREPDGMARAYVVIGFVLGVSGSAHALKPGTHADIAKASCLAAGLGKNLCTRIATEDYDTDSREWDDLAAHAQIDDGQTACVAADAAAGRLFDLGTGLRAALAQVAISGGTQTVGNVDALIGRALHTIQDNCAHHGMPNPQHAWFSLGDFCDGTATSPDLQEDAIACARTESDAAMREVAKAINAAGVAARLDAYSCPPAPNNNNHTTPQTAVCQGRFLPGPFDACAFLGRAKDWDGTDRTWNNGAVTPALQSALAGGLAGDAAVTAICGGDESKLSNAVSQSIVDVSAGAPSCPKVGLFCLGKADDSANPFADDPAPDASAGCNTGRSSTGLLVLLALATIRRRRG